MTEHSPATHQYDDNRAPLLIREISVLRAPGIASPFTLRDLSPEITIVFGPNASGKSTTARAIQAVLWPHATALRGQHLAAEFELGDDDWRIEASAGNVQRTRNGDPAEAPLIAPLDDRGRYSLGLPDLLASENQPLAQAILNESSGGFDLPMVAESLGFSGSIPPRLDSARAVQAANAEINQVIAAKESTRTALGERSQLLAQRNEAVRAGQDIAAIDKAIEYRRNLSDEDEVKAEIDRYAPEVRNFTGDEPGEIDRSNREIEQYQQRLNDVLRQRDRWQQMVESTGLADVESPQDQLKALTTIRSQQDEIATILNDVERDFASAVSEQQSHQHRLADDLNDYQIAALDAHGIRELADIAATYENIRARRTARDEVEHWLGGVSAPENLPALQQGVEILQSRLQHRSAAEHHQQTGVARWVGIGGGILLAAAGAYLALDGEPLWWILAVVGVILAILAWRFTASDSPRIAATLEQQYGDLNLPQPAEWRGDSIREVLGQLREELKVALVEQEKADRWQDLEQERADLDKAHAENEKRREAAVAKYGVAPDLKEESLRLLADNLGRWQASDAVVRGLQGRREKLRKDNDTLQQRANAVTSELGYEAGDLGMQLDDLQRRIDSLQHAVAERDVIQKELDDVAQPQLERATAHRDGIYQRFNLEPGDTSGLQHLQEQRSSLLAARERLNQRKESTRVAWESLSLTPKWRDLDIDDLTAARDAAEAIANRLPEIESQLRELDQLERSEMRSRDLENAQATLATAQDALARDRERIAASVVGDLLLGTVQQQTRDAALPIVFHRARELFAIITRGKYELQFEAGPPPEFTSLDTSTGMTLSLDQLSSGTRVQLLMAIRLAFVENVEVGPRLPVILDETLGNSDEFRASAIIDAAIDICKHGRQVFYFTAQGEEVARWQHRVEAMPEEERPTIRVIELADVRRDAGFDRLPIPNLAVTEPSSIPSPADYDRETWAATLRVPAIDPWAPIGSVHLWHLIADQEVLHSLLSNDIVTFGQLESLERTNPVRLAQVHERIPDLLHGIHIRAGLLRDTTNMWRIGRARPMPIGALAEADMIDANDLSEMEALQQEADNDGGALMERLQTMDDPPLAEKPMDALELWLISEGYVAQGQAMGMDDIRTRLIELGSPAIRLGDLDARFIENTIAQASLW